MSQQIRNYNKSSGNFDFAPVLQNHKHHYGNKPYSIPHNSSKNFEYNMQNQGNGQNHYLSKNNQQSTHYQNYPNNMNRDLRNQKLSPQNNYSFENNVNQYQDSIQRKNNFQTNQESFNDLNHNKPAFSFPPPPKDPPNPNYERPLPEISFQQFEGHVYRSQKRRKVENPNESNLNKEIPAKNIDFQKMGPGHLIQPPPPPKKFLNQNSSDFLDNLKVPSKEDLLVKRNNNEFLNNKKEKLKEVKPKLQTKEEKLMETNSKNNF